MLTSTSVGRSGTTVIRTVTSANVVLDSVRGSVSRVVVVVIEMTKLAVLVIS